MRRWTWAVTAALSTVLLAATAGLPAAAAPSPVPVPSPSPGTAVCTVDKELSGITGLAATANGYAVAVKGSSGINVKVYLLDAECRRTGKTVAYNADKGPRDPQDLQVAADGMYWVADTGDDPADPARPSVGVWKLAPDGRATLYRFSYPDRAQSAQALLINGDGNPIIITDNPRGPAGIYVPSGPLDSNGHPVLLKHAGDFTPQDTGTENKLSKIGMTRVTGAANSHDGTHVAIRTFSDAYEWSVTNGDVLGAITTGTPKITPLPNEPQGSAIAYSRDNANLLTVSDVDRQAGATAQILKYRPSPPAAAAGKPPAAAPGIAAKGDTRSWFGRLNLQDMLRIVGAVGVLGLLMVIGGVVGIRRARNRGGGTRGTRREPLAEDDPAAMNSPTAPLAQVPGGGRRDRYGDRNGPYYPPDYPPDAGSVDLPGSAGGYRGRGYGSVAPYPPAEADDRYPAADDRYPAPPLRPGAGPSAPGAGPSGPGTAPPSPARRSDRGIARSHRPGTRRGSRDNGESAGRGYSDQHEGFGDILDS